jgi:glutathione peroxidase-family protein
MLATPPAAAIGNVNVRDESYMNGARMNIDRIAGNVLLIIDSASRFVVM